MNTSKSPISGKKYNIPDGPDNNLKDFINRNKAKKIVAVQGLGFVGSVMSFVVANNDKDQYAVLGVDRASQNSYWKIGDINSGHLPLKSSDPLVETYFQRSKEKNNLYATFDEAAFSYADVIIIDINLDVTKIKDNSDNLESYDVPMESFISAVKSIGKVCKQDVLILVETTVPPGTCSKIVYPTIIEELKNRGLDHNKFLLGHSYERVMPGPNYVNSIKNFYRVYSGIDKKSADAIEAFLKTIISTKDYPLTRLKNTESTEMAKVLENSYRAMNISFVVEWSRFAENAGVDLYEVVNAIRLRPTHANLMYPGIGVGGYCLTKDPLMASWSSKEFFNLELGLPSSTSAVEINDHMPKYCFSFIEKTLSNLDKVFTNIGFLGVAYGPGIGDTRFSPVHSLYNFMNKAYSIICHDPYVNYWEELDIYPFQELDSFLNENLDCIVITTGHADYINSDNFYVELKNSKNSGIVIIDTIGLLDIKKLPSVYELGKNFFILGVGI